MRIVRWTEVHGNLLPSAASAISAIPHEYLHHEQHQILHPQSAYSTSIRLLTAQWAKTLDDLAMFRTRYFANRDDLLLKDVAASYSALLHKLNEHFDACYSVLRSLSPVAASKPRIAHPQHLESSRFVGWKSFREATRTYRESHLGYIVNSLKHSQGELCPLYFHSMKEFRPGYFLRGILPGGVRGPDPRLHPGGNTAISFSRDMLIHLWWLYRTSDLLTKTIASFLDATYKFKLSVKPIALHEAQMPQVLQGCASLSPEFFPDESNLPYPRIIHRSHPGGLLMEFPSPAGVHRMRGTVKIVLLSTVDSVYRVEKIPYMGRDAVPINSIERRS